MRGARRQGQPGLSILARGLRRRRVSAAICVLVAAVAIAGAAAGPIFLRAAGQSTLALALRADPAGSNAVTAVASGGTATYAAVGDALGHASPRWFEPPVELATAATVLRSPTATWSATLLSGPAICDQVHIVSGACPLRPGDAALSTRSATAAGLHLGSSLRLRPPHAGTAALTLRVVGLYAVPTSVADPYWQGSDYFTLGAGGAKGAPTSLDAVVAPVRSVLGAAAIGSEPQVTASAPVRTSALRTTDVAAFESSVSRLRAALSAVGLTSTAPFLATIGGWATSRNLMATVVDAIAVQVVVLSLLVFYALASISARDRRLEVDIARRRGFSRPALVAVSLGETVVLLVAALPLGLLAAWGVTAAVGSAILSPGTPVGLDLAAGLAGVIGLGGALVAALAATRQLWGGSGSRLRPPVAAAVGDALAVAAAAAGLLALTAGGSLDGSHPDPIALLAPGLLALGAGVLAVRLAQLVVRGVGRASRDSRRVSLFLAVRWLARSRPLPLRQILPLTAAVVLAVVAVESWAVAGRDRSTVTAFQVGAAHVVDVRVRPGVDLVTAVDRADPSGREAMAAAVTDTSSDNLLAVDPARLAAVSAWAYAPAGLPAANVARYLAPPTAAPVEFAASALRLELTTPPKAPALSLGITVFNLRDQDQETVTLARTAAGTHRYVVGLQGFCASTCRLVSISPSTASSTATPAGPVSITLDGLSVSHGAGWTSLPARAWTASPAGASVTGTSGSAVTFRVSADLLESGGIVLAPADLPVLLPAVATTTFTGLVAPTPPEQSVAVGGLDGNPVEVAARVQVPSLPEVGADGLMVSLPLVMLAQQNPAVSQYQVWLAPSAPPSVLARLRGLGVTPTSTASASAADTSASRTPLGLAYSIVLASGPVAVLLVAGTAAYGVVAAARRRRGDFVALAAAGVTRPVLVGSLVIENLAVAAFALVAGLATGLAATRLVLSSQPIFAGGTGGVPISHAPLAGPLLVVAGALCLAFGLAAVVPALVAGRATAGEAGETL